MFKTLVSMADGTQEQVTSLLSPGEWNPKQLKSLGIHPQYLPLGLALAAARSSGHEVCASRTRRCAELCLCSTGYSRVFPAVMRRRIAKTRLFFSKREVFLSQLRSELEYYSTQAMLSDKTLVVRLNLFSDLQWERLAPWIFTEYPDSQYYDYTKHVKRMRRYLDGKLPRNYHLTFSRSDRNDSDCLAILRAGGNVAVVFDASPFPRQWHGYHVHNGDTHDLRFLDPANHVIGLSAKGTPAKRDTEGFTVPTKRVALL